MSLAALSSNWVREPQRVYQDVSQKRLVAGRVDLG